MLKKPQIDPSAYIAPGAVVTGDVVIEADCSVFFGAVIRTEHDRITIGRGTNIQDNCVLHTDAGFSETLLRLIDESGKKDSQIYRRANLSKQHFSKIRSNPHYRPTKATALALAIALELDLPQTKDLIGRAGYALTNSSKSDVIVSYFISRGCFDLFEINAALFEFDQLTLGAS